MSVVDFMFSQRQQRMLAALLLHPYRQFGSNEIIALGGPGNGAGMRVLKQFERSGIVVKTPRGNQRLYSVNEKHPIYPELRSICLKSFGIAETILRELEPVNDRISLAFVFGSIARGADRAESDVDLMVVGNLDAFDLGPALERIEKILGREVDLNLYKPSEWQAAKGESVVGEILRQPRISLIGR